MESCLVGLLSPTVDNVSPARRTANFHPSIWGKSVITYNSNEQILRGWREKAETLKTEVLRWLRGGHCLPNKRTSLETLSLIDAIQRLGVAYHFEQEIKEELALIFTNYHIDNEDDEHIHTVALRFRLLREHGYNLTCDVFRKFMDNNGNFNKSMCDDAEGLLSLYEAAYLRVKGEPVLDEALKFTTNSLQSLLLSPLSPVVAKQVHGALYMPLRKRLPRVEARNYLSVYEQIDHHSEVLLEFAKLDFNILQNLHREELSIVSKWWYTELDCESNFSCIRDRIVEAYFWILGVYFEPQYTVSRRFLAQILGMISVLDDIYDAYGTRDELELFTEALVNRWDFTARVDLPDYMKAYCKQLLAVFHKKEEESIMQGTLHYGLECAKQEFKRISRAYIEERRWLDRQNVPTIEEYKEVALVSSAYILLSVISLVSMGDAAETVETFDWMRNQPRIVMASTIIGRLMNDIMSHKFEQERGDSPSAIECYTAQYNVSEEEAYDVFRKEVEEAWKDVNEAFLRPTPVATSALTRVLNLSRVAELFYKESDDYTHVSPALQECITSVLFSDVPV